MLFEFLLIGGCIGHVLSACPHENPWLKRWSDTATWGSDGKPVAGSSVLISDHVLVDEDFDVYNITVASAGSLVFDPSTALQVRAGNVYVDGTFQVGSEECPYTGQLTVTLTGNRGDHMGEKESKVILIRDGGTIEMHGDAKMPWSKLDRTLVPTADMDATLFYDHSKDARNDELTWVRGLAVYIFNFDDAGQPTVKDFGVFEINYQFAGLMAILKNVADGDILMIASQRYLKLVADSTLEPQVFEQLETTLYGAATGTSLLRTVSDDGQTYALVYQKGQTDSLQEVTNPFGTASYARLEARGYVFSAETAGARWTSAQHDNFRIGTPESIYPKLILTDDVTSWLPGDRIVVASTDFNLEQSEEFTVVSCQPGDCANNEIRIADVIKNTHYGEIVKGAIDMRAEVAVINRGVVIQGEMEEGCPEVNENCLEYGIRDRDTFGAHVKVLRGYANARIQNIELRNVGQQTDLGRYPIHFHMALDKRETAAQPYVQGCSIHHSFSRCVTIHGTHGVLVRDNVCYEHMGHGYYLEDGGEKHNVFDGNLAINTRRTTGKLEPTDKTSPAAFWMTNPLVSFTNNVAAGGEGTGIWFLFPDEPLGPSRELGLMAMEEAKRTMITAFTNNVGHSQRAFGITIGMRLLDDRSISCCSEWQPRANVSDPESQPLNIPLDKITGYKCRKTNVWIEGGLLDVTHISVADSTNGMIISNEGLEEVFGGKISKGVVIGESPNIGVPIKGFSRSLPYDKWDPAVVQSGVSTWKGPMKFSDMWFDSFQSNPHYDIAAIAKKRKSTYFFSQVNSFENIQFAFADEIDGGTYTISGDRTDVGWEENEDGELNAGFTYYLTDDNGVRQAYHVVKPDPLSAAGADCELRPNWRLAICTTKYGNLRMTGSFRDEKVGVFVRDDVPSAELEFEVRDPIGPTVVLDGSVTYTVHYPKGMPDQILFTVPGLDKGDTLRAGFCVPVGATIDLRTSHPHSLAYKYMFVRVDSLDELDREDPALDGKKYYHDETNGMIYYKFINTETRSPDESHNCNGHRCPDLRIRVFDADLSSVDCRDRIYTPEQRAMTPPTLPLFTDPIPPTGDPTPPSDFGAGSTRPFPSRAATGPVDGGWGGWGSWSQCSESCGDGVQYRTRLCNNPIPINGGATCAGDNTDQRSCFVKTCPTNGGLSEWSAWSTCRDGDADDDTSTCSGYRERTRDCDSPLPQAGGTYCSGLVREIEACVQC